MRKNQAEIPQPEKRPFITSSLFRFHKDVTLCEQSKSRYIINENQCPMLQKYIFP